MIWKIRKQKTPNYKSRKKKELKNEDYIRILWDNLKHTHIHIIGMLEGEEREQGMENLFEEIMMEKFSNLVKVIDIQVQELQSPKQDEPKEAHTKTHHN